MNTSDAVPVLVTGAAVLLGLSLAVSSGIFDPYALVLVTLAGSAAFAAAHFSLRSTNPPPNRLPLAILGFGIGVSLIHDILFLPGILVIPNRLGGFRPGILAIAIALATYFWRSAPVWIARMRFPVIVLIATGLGAIILYASPTPGIDVWQLQQGGELVLLSGENPYHTLYPNVYGPGTHLIDTSLLSPDGRYVVTYPYMPLMLLLGVPSAIFGDVRWTMLASVAFSALLIRQLGHGSIESELAGIFLLVQPQAFMVLELAWTEPLVLATILLAFLIVTTVQEGCTNDGKNQRWQWLAAVLLCKDMSSIIRRHDHKMSFRQKLQGGNSDGRDEFLPPT